MGRRNASNGPEFPTKGQKVQPREFGTQATARRRPWRTWAGAVAAMLFILGGGLPARAQDDPPGRIGRLNYLQGEVSFSPAGSDDWVEARSTRPITSGDRIWMDRGARSELSIGSAVLRADGETSLKVLQLDDGEAQFQLSEGTLAVQVRDLDQDDRLEIATPNLAFVIDRPGDYRIEVNPDRDSTEISVRRGQGWAHADDGRHRLAAPAYARFVGERAEELSDALPERDGFDRWVEARIDRGERRPAARYVPREMVGYEDLDDYGSWSQEPDYGWIWVPRITVSNWAPYRHGHWAWIAPWGWTWVDDAPWGFAPFHYGRWAYVRSHWAWVPGPVVRRPYYAPALVAFVGRPGGASLTLSSGPAVAWFPLGPWEEYRPVYRASPTYITYINRVVVVDRERSGRRGRWRDDDFVNRRIPGAATALSARAFVEGRPVGREHIRVPERELQQAAIAGTMPALAPVKASLLGQGRRLDAPRRQERERQVVTTRMPAPPPVERDELAKRFAQGGGQVREAGPSLADQIRRVEERQDKRPRLVAPRGQGGEERRPPAAAAQPAQPQADRPREGQREDVIRDLRAPGREESPRPEAGERPRREREDSPRELRPGQEAIRPPVAPRATPEASQPQRPDRIEEQLRERSGPNRPAEPRAAPQPGRERGSEPERRALERPAAPEAAQPQRPDRLEEQLRQRERAEPQRPAEPRAAPEPGRERGPDPERRVLERPGAPPQMREERSPPRLERPEEERRPREVQQQREIRMEQRIQEARPERRPEPQVRPERAQPRPEVQREPHEPRAQERPQPQARPDNGGRERKERERIEQGLRQGQPE
jgi:hypothetical protein